MTRLSELAANSVAVITGGADGIGLAAARHFSRQGMRVCIVDIDEGALASAAASDDHLLPFQADVSDPAQVETLRSKIYQACGRVDVLMNNAATGLATSAWSDYENWRRTLEVNLFGVVHGLQSFVPAMLEQATPGLVINTGSKQGITNPPGGPAYNASKAAIKIVTEQLAHSFRDTEGCQLSAHLLIPGFTYTGMIRKWVQEKPDGAWTPEQVVAFMVAALDREEFYMLCPDNDVSREVDNKRMAWAIGDVIENRPPLSRWHPDYESAFAASMEESIER
ncbi:MAG: SDR family oxidoreductase [Pseudomonadota bacterium]